MKQYPVIGIVAREVEVHAPILDSYFKTHGVFTEYVHALDQCGAGSLLIPLHQDTDKLYSLFQRLDGILLAGGEDIELSGTHHAELEGHTPHLLRSETELRLLSWAKAEKKPVLGICRGMQLISIDSGGHLYLDLEEEFKTDTNHYVNGSHEACLTHAHRVDLETSSCLSQWLQSDSTLVNSIHHQGIAHVGPELMVSATAEDGLIEAVESTPSAPHLLFGVQWHPEMLVEQDEASRQLFQGYVDCVRENS